MGTNNEQVFKHINDCLVYMILSLLLQDAYDVEKAQTLINIVWLLDHLLKYYAQDVYHTPCQIWLLE